MQIPAAMGGFLIARGHWDQAAALYQTALTAARQAGDRPAQACTLHDLGVMGTLTGDYTAAAAKLGPGGRALRSYRRPGWPGLRLVPTGHRATLDRQLLRRPGQPMSRR